MRAARTGNKARVRRPVAINKKNTLMAAPRSIISSQPRWMRLTTAGDSSPIESSQTVHLREWTEVSFSVVLKSAELLQADRVAYARGLAMARADREQSVRFCQATQCPTWEADEGPPD